jgi:hypothetical protein
MRTASYTLITKSAFLGERVEGPRILGFSMRVECEGAQLGGNNVQLTLGAPDRLRHGLDNPVAMWLPTDWWVSLRNQFERTPDVAATILRSAEAELSKTTAAASAPERMRKLNPLGSA